MTQQPTKPIDVACPICNAKPGEHCYSLVDASRKLEVFHYSRGKDLK